MTRAVSTNKHAYEFEYHFAWTGHAKFNFDQTTWVVWENSQFATVLGVFFVLFMPLPHRVEKLSDAFVWRLTSVGLTFVAYIGPNSRTGRPRKTKNWHRGSPRHIWLGHQFQGQKVKGQLPVDVINSQHAETGATWQINTKILSTCRDGILCRHAHSVSFCFLRLAYKSHRRMNRHQSRLSRRVLRQGCAFWEYLIFTFFAYFSPKFVKIKPEIGNFKPKCWNMKCRVFEKIRNRTPWKFKKWGT